MCGVRVLLALCVVLALVGNVACSKRASGSYRDQMVASWNAGKAAHAFVAEHQLSRPAAKRVPMVHLQQAPSNASGGIGNATSPGAGGNSTAVPLCERMFMNMHQTMSADPSCMALLEMMGGAETATLEDLSRWCANSCWGTFVSKLQNLDHFGCMGEDFDIAPMQDMCTSFQADCTSAVALDCVNQWVSAGCPETEPPQHCAPFLVCAYNQRDRCPGPEPHAPPAPTGTIRFTVSLPLTIDPQVFLDTYGTDFVRTTAAVAQCSVTAVKILSAIRGSVVVTAQITVTNDQVWPVATSLDAALNSTAFADSLNAHFAGSISVATVTRVGLHVNTTEPPPAMPVHDAGGGDAGGAAGGAAGEGTSGSGSGGALPHPTIPTITPPPHFAPPSGEATASHHCPNNCSSHGTCYGANGGRATCLCDKPYGRSNSSAVQDCSEYTLSMCEDSCYGHGRCIPFNRTMTCQCFAGFTNPTCNRWNRCQGLNYCSGNGNCTRSYPTSAFQPEACVCYPGYTGADCSVRIVGCESNCAGHGLCQTDEAQVRTCECDVGFTGPACDRVAGPYCDHHCSGLGSCHAGNCSCSLGASGPDCSELSDPCGGCLHGFCHQGICECIGGFSGEHCEVYNATLDFSCSALGFCSGKGMCHRTRNETTGVASYMCTCFEGFTGPKCSVVDVNYEDQCPNHCSGNGRCMLLDSPHCSCNAGWTGADCATSACPTASGQPCSAQGVCEKAENGHFHCVCDEGFTHGSAGACENSLCENGCSGKGRCTANGTCVCTDGYTGADCSQQVAKVRQVLAEGARDDEETGNVVDASMCQNGCSKHGQCVMGHCECRPGYTGEDCSREAPSLFEDEDDLDNLDMLELEGANEGARRGSMARLWD